MNPLKRIEKEIMACVKCGVCRAHCPVFSELGREPAVARGKVALARAILRNDLELDCRSYADMSRCLLCGSCVGKCPNDVPTDEIVIAAREVLARKRGLTTFHKVVRRLLRNRGLMDKGAFLASILRPLLMRRVPQSSGLRLRFPLPYLGWRRHVPPIAARPFMERHPEVTEGEPGRPRIVYFVGCMTNFIYPGIGEAALSLFRELGCTVIIPRDQQCCGLPAMSGGDVRTLGELAARNLDSLERFRPDYIVTACASCGGALHKYYPRVVAAARPDLAERCRSLAEKTVDATALLEMLGYDPLGREAVAKTRVTYHDPCHLRERKVTGEPRRLLRGLPGTEFVEMANADTCCGLGGTFNVYHYDTSMAINARKCAAIRECGADIALTGCPGCMMQLSDGLARAGMGTRVMHTLEILARRRV